ncbi:MAG TPA: tripartite tricarboxylate transporter substrate-binding protein [Bordetella sp.]|nr:tripartite tricarboxylate transporter substrate-binding protein [Bordetella sp.]
MRPSSKRRSLITAGIVMPICAAVGLPRKTLAQPTEIRMLVPLTAGSSVDVIARAVSAEMGKALGQNIFVDNRPGVDSIVATQAARNAKPDGKTVVMLTPSHAINVFLHPDVVTYDPIKDFTLVGLTATNMNLLVVPANSSIHSVAELIAAAKAKPNTLNYGNSGGTSGGSAQLLNLYAGIRTTDVKYKGAPEVMNDVIAGRLDFTFTAMSSALAMVRAGKARALAVTGRTRHPSLPDVPTVAETLPGFEAIGWYGVAGPAGIAQDTVTKLNRALMTALGKDNVKTVLSNSGFDPAPPNTPEDFRAFVRQEIDRWGKVTKPANSAS